MTGLAVDDISELNSRTVKNEADIINLRERVGKVEESMASSKELERVEKDFKTSLASLAELNKENAQVMYERTNKLSLQHNAMKFYALGVIAVIASIPATFYFMQDFMAEIVAKQIQQAVPAIQSTANPLGFVEQEPKKFPVSTGSSNGCQHSPVETSPDQPFPHFPSKVYFIIDTRRFLAYATNSESEIVT
jgi:hypothetical protein